MKLRSAAAVAFLIATALSPQLLAKGGVKPTPTPTQSAPPAPTLVARANSASLTQPIALDWNAVSATGGPIGSYTWQVGTTSAFTTIIASGFTNMESDPTIPTRTEDKLTVSRTAPIFGG